MAATASEAPRRWPAPLAAALALALPACVERSARDDAAPADLVVAAPLVRTLDPRRPTAHVVAIRDGRIVAVGEERDVAALLGPRTRRIELPAGSCLLPGFIDSHAHLLGLGRSLLRLDLAATRDLDEVVAKARERAARTPAGRWVLGRGWDQNRWPSHAFPDHAALSAAVPDAPVLLQRVDGHAALANARALALAGIDATTRDPEGGEIVRRADGTPSGVLVDAAVDLVERVVPPPTTAEDEEALAAAQDECRRHGITSLHDAGEGRAELALLRRAAELHRLTVRVDAMVDGSDDALVAEWFARGPSVGAGGGFLTVRAIKLYADGALGSRGAALLEDYADRPGHRGLFLNSAERIADVATRALEAGFQVCTHAIGDAANRRVLDAYAAALAAHARAHPGAARPDHRFRVEHAQVVAPADVPRFRELGVLASVQTRHATSDAPWAVDRLGVERATREAYVWRTLLDAGATLCNGTDAPVEPIAPLRNLYAAITRRDEEGRLAEPFTPSQCLTREEALASVTAAGAYAAFEEHEKGRLAPGFLADLVATSVDPLMCDPRDLLTARVLLTMVGGEAVLDAPGGALPR
jgi:predicted amidohydrolase YtcJ